MEDWLKDLVQDIRAQAAKDGLILVEIKTVEDLKCWLAGPRLGKS